MIAGRIAEALPEGKAKDHFKKTNKTLKKHRKMREKQEDAEAASDTEVVQRWMSKDELKATQETGLLRGGREGTQYATDSANASALRARQRSALPQTPEVKVTLEVSAGKFSSPSKVEPAFNMPGGGMERTATGEIPVKIIKAE